MKAWILERLGGHLELRDVPRPEPRPGGVLVKIEASMLMSYMRPYVEGKLPVYNAPKTPFTPGGNGVGTVTAVGRDVWHVKPGQRVVISSSVAANENVEEPGQFLLGITAFAACERARGESSRCRLAIAAAASAPRRASCRPPRNRTAAHRRSDRCVF